MVLGFIFKSKIHCHTSGSAWYVGEILFCLLVCKGTLLVLVQGGSSISFTSTFSPCAPTSVLIELTQFWHGFLVWFEVTWRQRSKIQHKEELL